MSETGRHHCKQNKPDTERQIACFLSHVVTKIKKYISKQVNLKVEEGLLGTAVEVGVKAKGWTDMINS
jgi:GH24 family phage-related lysozyme (muramidase)